MAAVCPGAPRKCRQLRIRIPPDDIKMCGKRLFREDTPIRHVLTTPTNQPIRVDEEALRRAPGRSGKRRHVVLRKGRKLKFWT